MLGFFRIFLKKTKANRRTGTASLDTMIGVIYEQVATPVGFKFFGRTKSM